MNPVRVTFSLHFDKNRLYVAASMFSNSAAFSLCRFACPASWALSIFSLFFTQVESTVLLHRMFSLTLYFLPTSLFYILFFKSFRALAFFFKYFVMYFCFQRFIIVASRICQNRANVCKSTIFYSYFS